MKKRKICYGSLHYIMFHESLKQHEMEMSTRMIVRESHLSKEKVDCNAVTLFLRQNHV